MAWSFQAIDATLSPWPRRLDGVEAHKGLRNNSRDNLTHWLISTQVHDPVGARRLNLTRMIKARGLDPTDKYWAAYIQQGCDDASREPAAQRKGLGARLDSLTNLAALKEECRAHGLPASGTKAKLSQRLRDYASGVEPTKGKRRRGA